jgi:hypothetical protein
MASWIIPVHTKKFFFLLDFYYFSHCFKLLVLKKVRVEHWQLTVKPFHGSCAVFDINACFCQIVSTQNDILLASL